MIHIHVVCSIELQCRHRTSLKGACSRVPTWTALSASLLGHAGLQRPARDDGDFMGGERGDSPHLATATRVRDFLARGRACYSPPATPATSATAALRHARHLRFNATAQRRRASTPAPRRPASKMHCWTLLSFPFSTDARWCYVMILFLCYTFYECYTCTLCIRAMHVIIVHVHVHDYAHWLI
jgi:hypothetical protein